MGKKVKVTTKCGETFYYDHDQEVKAVEIVKKRDYPLQGRLDNALETLNPSCTGVSCDDCAFRFRDIEDDAICTKSRARKILEKAHGYQGGS